MFSKEGLIKTGGYCLLDVDAHLADRLKAVSAAERDFQSFAERRQAIETDIAKTQATLATLHGDYDSLIPVRDNESDSMAKDRVTAKMDADLDNIAQGEKYLVTRKADISTLKQPTDAGALSIRLAANMDAAAMQYEMLAQNASIREALTADHAKLGPSPMFKQQWPRIKTQRDKSKAFVIPLASQGGVPVADVLVNHQSIPMTVAPDEDWVLLTHSAAAKAGIQLGDQQHLSHYKLSDSREFIGQTAVALELQVGPFVLRNVPCLVQVQGADESDGCILGRSFLKEFWVQPDLANGQMTLRPISAAASVRPPQGKSPTTSAATAPSDDGNLTLTMTARIDGSDSIHVSAKGLTWTHNYAAWPGNVMVNGLRWNPQTWATIAPIGAFESLAHVDFSTGKITDRSGRGQISLKAEPDAATLVLDDPDEGTDQYSVTLRFSPPQVATTAPTSAPATAPTTAPATAPTTRPDAFTLTIKANVDTTDVCIVSAEGLMWHHYGHVPQENVTINGTDWLPTQDETLPSKGTLEVLKTLDLSGAHIVDKVGRANCKLILSADGLHVIIRDGFPGRADCTLTVGFPAKP